MAREWASRHGLVSQTLRPNSAKLVMRYILTEEEYNALVHSGDQAGAAVKREIAAQAAAAREKFFVDVTSAVAKYNAEAGFSSRDFYSIKTLVDQTHKLALNIVPK